MPNYITPYSNIKYKLTPMLVTIHLLSYTAMVYALNTVEDHPDPKVREKALLNYQRLQTYINSLHPNIKHDLIDETQMNIDDHLKHTFAPLYGREMYNIIRLRMDVYLVAAYFAAQEILKFRKVLRKNEIALTEMVKSAASTTKHTNNIDLITQGRDVYNEVAELSVTIFSENHTSTK